MDIKFKTLGITFDAEVTGDEDNVIFETLTVEGNDAMWLCDSTLIDQIETAAWKEFKNAIKKEKDDSIIGAYVTDNQWRQAGAI